MTKYNIDTVRHCLWRAVLILLLPVSVYSLTQWQSLAPGIDYTTLSPYAYQSIAKLHVFRINLHQHSLRLVFAKQLAQDTAPISQLATIIPHTLIAINGGFFSKTHQPLGLRIDQKQQYSALKPISWWSVLVLDKQKQAHILSLRQYQAQHHRDWLLALQAGPQLIRNHQILSLKNSLHARSAVGITQQGQLILLASDNALLTTSQIARIMIASPNANGLDCVEALNLDGGSSTQLVAHVGPFYLMIKGARRVTDALVVT